MGVLTLLTYYHYACKGHLLSSIAKGRNDTHVSAATLATTRRCARFVKWSGAWMKQMGTGNKHIKFASKG